MKYFVTLATAALLAMLFTAWHAAPPQKPNNPILHLETLSLATTWKYAQYRAIDLGSKGHLDVDGTVHLGKGVTRKQFMKALAAYITISYKRGRCEVVIEEQ